MAKTEMDSLRSNVLSYLSSNHPELFGAWTDGSAFPKATVQDHCDMVYSLYLLGELSAVSAVAVDGFCRLARATELPGWRRDDALECLSVHNCAYLLGAANLLEQSFPGTFSDMLDGRDFKLEQLVDPSTFVPRFPRRWAHHSWRVSHWLGGVPSIVLSLETSAQGNGLSGLSARIRGAVAGLMNPDVGLIKAYRSDLLQRLFRAAYNMRHDPDLGDIGGVAHILWVDHAMGRPYMALPQIQALAAELFRSRKPFMEAMPYCLDFDVVQALRTSSAQLGNISAEDRGRARLMMRDIDEFYQRPPARYTLHKVPGALATYHECRLLLGEDGMDIIKAAHWL